MKINVAGGLFRSYRASDFGGNKADTSSPSTGRAKRDQFILSKQVLEVIQIQNSIMEIEQAKKSARNSPEAQMLDNTKKAMDVLKTCSKIAARIRDGDKVPLKDLQYLMKNDPQAYQMAMASRKPKDDSKEWERAISNGEQEDRQSDGDTGGQTDGVQTSSGAEVSSGMASDGAEAGPSGVGV